MEGGKTKKVLVVVCVVLGLCGWARAVDSNGLISHWAFDEGDGNVAYDSAGYNDGTIYGAEWTMGILNGALDFDGTSDYVSVPHDTGLNITGDITISAWVYFTEGGSGQDGTEKAIVTKCVGSGTTNNPFDFRTNNTAEQLMLRLVRADAAGHEVVYSTDGISLNSWHHVLVRVQDKIGDFYVDGTVTTKAGSFNKTPTGNTQPLLIGRRDDGLYLGGMLDDVRIYGRALSAGEVEQLYQEGAGPIAHWKFDEGEGSVAYDSAGDNDGDIYGAQWTTGILDGGLSFDGYDDCVAIGPGVLPVGRKSIFAWVKLPPVGQGDGTAYDYFIYYGKPDIGEVVLYFNNGTEFRWINSNSGGFDARYTVAMDDDDWHFAGVTYDDSVHRLYLDGNEVATSAGIDHTTITSEEGIGGHLGDSTHRSWLGIIDNVRIYDRALSAEEVQQLYEEGTGPGPAPTGVFYVDGVNGSDLNDGLTLETAFATIQKGIDEANDDNTVLVYPAVYQEEINFNGKAIMVEGVATEAGPAVLEAPPPMDYAVSMYLEEGPDSILKHFVIRNSDMAFFLAGSSPTLSHLTIVDNQFGIAAYAGAVPDISNCILYNNTDGDLFQCEARYSWVQEEIEGPNVPTAGLVSNWRFDDGSGTTASDSAGSNQGTIYGALWSTGILGGALDFDGIDDFVDVPDDPSLDGMSALTLTGWVRTGESGIPILNKFVFFSGTAADDSYWLSVTQGGTAYFIYTIGTTVVAKMGTTNVADNSWHHVAGVYTGSGGIIYIDGGEDPLSRDDFDPGGAINDSSTNFRVGRDNRAGEPDSFFDGLIDDVRIYNRALSAGEVEQLYEAGTGQAAPSPMFADAAGGDYHLLSERGRYWPAMEVWVLDEATSPCVDGGDPNENPSGERMPNGGRLNMGVYGGTAYASMSEWPIREDNNQDGIVNMVDFAMLAERWLEKLGWAE